MLDLDPIKSRIAAGATELAVAGNYVLRNDGDHVGDSLDDATRRLVANAPADLAALVAEVERLRRILGCFDHMGGGMALHPCPTPEDYRRKGELIYDLATGLVTPDQYEGSAGASRAKSEASE